MIDHENIMVRYGDYPLSILENDEGFIGEISGTGENQSRFLVRRFSFRKPRLSIRTADKGIVHIDMLYGLSNRQTLLTVEREVIETAENTDYATITVKSKDVPLHTIEETINQTLGTKGWKFNDDIRHKPIASFLTQQDPYAFRVSVNVDTLRIYVNTTFTVMMDWMEMKDLLAELKRNTPELSEEVRKVEIMDFGSVPLYQRYKHHVNNQPHIRGETE